jgi:hypothetical protein
MYAMRCIEQSYKSIDAEKIVQCMRARAKKAVDAVAKPRHDGLAYVPHMSLSWTILAQPRRAKPISRT